MAETALDKVIREGVTRGMIGNISRLSENIGDQLARELWADPEFRADLQVLMRQFGKDALKRLTTEPAPDAVEDLARRVEKLETWRSRGGGLP